MLDLYEVAGGTVQGRDHVRSNKNNHDAFWFEHNSELLAGVVCDGCGSGAHSEVGSKIGAKLVVQQLFRQHARDTDAFGPLKSLGTLARVQRSVLSYIQILADSMGGSFSETIKDYFLFTAIGFVVTRESQCIFSVGDGVVLHDGQLTSLGEEGSNAPEYLSYPLVNTASEIMGLRLIIQGSPSQSFLVGTDGVHDLIRASEKPLPGKSDPVGPISQFWESDKYFKNPFAVQRRLNLINRESSRINYKLQKTEEAHGHLSDDTTLVVVRRKFVK